MHVNDLGAIEDRKMDAFTREVHQGFHLVLGMTSEVELGEHGRTEFPQFDGRSVRPVLFVLHDKVRFDQGLHEPVHVALDHA